MVVCEIDNIKIASINQKFGSGYGGRLYLRPEYRNFKDTIKAMCKRVKISAPYAVSIHATTSTDIDAFIKATLDGVQAAGVIDDDKNIVELHIYKTPVKRTEQNSIMIEVDNVS